MPSTFFTINRVFLYNFFYFKNFYNLKRINLFFLINLVLFLVASEFYFEINFIYYLK